jgi:hypothetical protein
MKIRKSTSPIISQCPNMITLVRPSHERPSSQSDNSIRPPDTRFPRIDMLTNIGPFLGDPRGVRDAVRTLIGQGLPVRTS